MSQGNEENQQCFIPAYWEQASIETCKDQEFIYLNINRLLEQAKQLQNRTKPKNLQPRTCFLELPLKKLPEFLQQPCVQLQSDENESGPFMPVQNPDHLSLQEYFQDHEVIYNKMKLYNRPNFEHSEPTSRFKPLSLLFDFHEKLFKQLGQNDEIKSPMSVAINDQFDSTFEGGNLGLVYKKEDGPERQYFLLLENDVNSHGYTSWFFFKVKSCGRGRACFHILNLSKSPYLYKIGWKISTFSVGKFHENNTRWFKGGRNIQTYSTNFEKKAGGGDTFSCVYFEYQFEQNESQVYFSMNRPYTYTMLTKSIEKMEKSFVDQASSTQIQILKSFYSISCNIIPIILLNQKFKQNENFVPIEEAKISLSKKVIVFMARQHPGEVIGSNLMDKIMEILSIQTEEVRQLLKIYTFLLIPMANPDGVIHGNSRCNFSGLDLNRQWMKQSMKEVTPETFYLRKLLWEIQENVGIEYLIDLHGHSKKMNAFFFCNKFGDKYPSEYFPFVMSRINKRFDLSSSTFNTTSDKKNTLRNQLYEAGMKNCITVQSSYFGFWQEKTARLFKDRDFYQMADSLFKTLYFMLVDESEKQPLSIQEFGFSRQAILNQVKLSRQFFTKKSIKSAQNDDIQSESDPEADIMKPDEMLRIYQKEDSQVKKKSAPRKKNRTRKIKEIKKPEIDKEDQIRASEPMKMHKEMTPQIESKAHKSQKKLEAVVYNKKSITQLKFRETQKPLISQKKHSIKKQEPIRQKVINMNEEQVDVSPKQIKQTKGRGKIFGVPFPKQNYQNYLTKCNKSRLIQGRLRTQVQTSKSRIQREVGSYGKIKEESIKIFLNETLSISKVNQVSSLMTNGLNEIKARKQSLKGEKNVERSTPLQNQNRSELKIALEIDNNSKGVSISKQKQERKKYLSRNYKKEMVRRKKILSSQEQAKKYKRFQNFMTSEDKEDKKSVKPQCNSVFYYFPLL